MTIYILYYIAIIMLYVLLGRRTFVLGQNDNFTGGIKNEKKVNAIKVYVFITTFLLILIFGLRSQDMGVDLANYLPSFDKINRLSWKEVFALRELYNYERGYIVFNKLIGTIWNDRQFFLFVCAACALIPIGSAIYKHSSYVLDSWIVYLGLPVFLLTFSGLRHAIAIGITAISYTYIKEKKLLRFILVVLLASLFHSSAPLFLFAYPIYRLKLPMGFAIFNVILLPVVWMLRTPLFGVLTALFGSGDVVLDNNGAITLFIVFSLIYVFCMLIGNRENESVNGFTNLFYVACVIQAMGGLNYIVVRVGYYYMISLAFCLPEIINESKFLKSKQDRQLVRVVVLTIFVIYGLFSLYNSGSGWAESYPYTFFWNE